MDFKFGQTLKLLGRTMPFLVFRFLVYIGIVVAWIAVIAVGAGVGALFGVVGGSAGSGAGIGGFLGFIVTVGLIFFLRRYLLYMVKGAHIAVLVEAIDGRELPSGKGQVSFGQQTVKDRFAEVSVMFGVDAVIKGILRAFNRLVGSVANLLPIPGVQQAAGVFNAVVNRSLTYVDEVILGHNMRVRSQNPWQTSQQGLVLYAQNYKQFLKNAVRLTLLVWLLTFLIFLVVLAPVAGIIAITPMEGGIITLLVAVLLAWGLKNAIIEPFAVTAMLQVWVGVTEGQVPNPEWEAKLDKASKKFGEMSDKARDWARDRGTPSDGGALAGLAPAPPSDSTPAAGQSALPPAPASAQGGSPQPAPQPAPAQQAARAREDSPTPYLPPPAPGDGA